MGTKDRLAALRAKSVFTADEEPNQSVTIMMAGVNDDIPRFEQEIEKLKGYMDKMDEDINRIVKLYSTDLNNYKACQENKPIIEELMNDIRVHASAIRNKLKEFDDDLERLKKKGQTHAAEFRIKSNQHSYVLNTFKRLMLRYNDIQIEYRDKCKEKIKRELEITGKIVSDEELDNMIESGDLEVFTENYQSDKQKHKDAIDDLKRQEKELEKLEDCIRQVHQYFVDIAALIEHQGALVDRIEHQVSNAKEFAIEGVKQTTEGKKYHESLIKKKFCCYSVLLVIVILLVIYTVIEFTK